MASSENQQHNPNPAPPSLSAGDHEMRDYYAAQDASRPPSQQEPYLTPYLGLNARLSQTWYVDPIRFATLADMTLQA